MRYFSRIPLALTSAMMLHSAGALAQSSDEDELKLIYGDKSTVRIATGDAQSLRRAPAVATVITAEDIAAMGATDLDQILETVPGLHVSRSPNMYSPLYVIRGIFSQYVPQTLMLQNGIPLTTLFNGNKGNIWGGYPVEHIERIEIIRGPGSALYGADAYSGVVNIITKTAAEAPGTEVGARGGSFATRDVWLQHGGKAGPADLAFYLRVGNSDGSREIIKADAQTRNDTLFGTHVSLAPGPISTDYDAVDANLDLAMDKWRLRAGYKLRDNVGTGAGIASAIDPVGKPKSERITGDLSWTDPQFSPNWGAGVMLSYLGYEQRISTYLQLFPAGLKFPTGLFPNGMSGNPETSERQLRLSAFATYAGLSGNRMRFGVGHDDLNLYDTKEMRNFIYAPNGLPIPVATLTDYTNTSAFLTPHRRRVNYFYAQDEINLANDWTLTLGARHDRYSDFGSTTNPRVALVWDASLDLTAKVLYGSAFRAPAFVESYGAGNPVAIGNPNLAPETIRTIETAIAWKTSRNTELNLNVFHYQMKDIIRTKTNSVVGTGSTFANVANQHGKGLELEGLWDISSSLRLTGNYAYQHSIDETTNKDAGYAPHHDFNTRLDWRFTDGWLFSPQLTWVAGRKRAAGDARADIADYKTLDLTLRNTRSVSAWEFTASVRNLFNADVREPSLAPGLALPFDLPMARRSLYLQAVYKL